MIKIALARPRRTLSAIVAALVALSAPLLSAPRADAQQNGLVRMAGSLAPLAAASPVVGPLDEGTPLHLSFILPLRDPAGAEEFVRRVSDPADPLYGQYLTPEQFVARFGPSQADYDRVTAYAQAEGMTVERTYGNRGLLDVAVSAAAAARIFQVHFAQHKSLQEGRLFYAADAEPAVPADIARVISGVGGMDSAFRPISRLRRTPARLVHDGLGVRPLSAGPRPRAAGPIPGLLTPAFLKNAYRCTTPLTGAGIAVGTVQYGGYSAADVQTFKDAFGLPPVALQDRNVTGVAFTDNNDETLLDIDWITGIASGVTTCIQYNGGAFSQNFALIASDNAVKVMSCSWGTYEEDVSNAERASEESSLTQMGAQGITFCEATGDYGPYTSGNKADGFTTDLFGALPHCLGVGGAVLTYDPNTGAYISETSWDDKNPDPTQVPLATGGGISHFIPIPGYQAGLGTSVNFGSATMRMVPDVSLAVKDFQIFKDGAWEGLEGTSASSPSFAGFLAIINQARAVNGGATLGFLNPALYSILRSARYGADFRDIQDGSTNDFYPAVPGYDLSTGIGTPIVDTLMTDLTTSVSNPQPLTGTVTDAVTGAGLGGSTVTFTGEQAVSVSFSVTADASGTFSVSLPTLFTSGGVTRTLTYTATASAAGHMTKTVGGVAAPGTLTLALTPYHAFTPASTIQMVSSPYDDTGAGDFATLFGLTNPVVTGTAVVASWRPELGAYGYYPNAPSDTFHLGRGYFIRFPGPVGAAANTTVMGTGVAASTGQPYRLSLQTGWNMIGDPFLTPVTLSHITVESLNTAPLGTSRFVALPLYTYTGSSTNPYAALGLTDALQPWVGYWVYAAQPVVLVIPPN